MAHLDRFLHSLKRQVTAWAEATLEEEQPQPQPPPPPRGWQRPINAGSFGSAHFSTWPEVEKSGLLAETAPGLGVNLGRYVEAYEPFVGQPPVPTWHGGARDLHLSYRGETNIVTIAPAGAGKGTAAIIPTLLGCDASMFVLDVKGENWFVSAPARRAMGHELVLIDPFGIWGDDHQLGSAMPSSARFNPLEQLRPEQKRFSKTIDDLAAAIIVVEGKDPHWGNRARLLLSCLMAFVCSDPHELAKGNNNLPYVRQVLGKSDGDFAAYMTFAAENSPLPIVRDNASSFAAIDSREVSGVKSTAIAQLGFLNHEGIRHFLRPADPTDDRSSSSFSFSELRNRPMTVFCMFPPAELDTYFRFARLMVQCFFTTMSDSPAPNDRPVLALLDEQAKLRHMEIIETSAALLRGYRVRIWSIFQDINQIKSIYKDSWETFISNAGIIQVMTPNDATTAEYISKRVGNETITEYRTSTNTPARHPAAPYTGGSTGRGETVFGRPLLSPQDLYAMPKDRQIILRQGDPNPIMTTREAYHEQKTFYGIPYAPHPVQGKQPFDWMKAYLTRQP